MERAQTHPGAPLPFQGREARTDEINRAGLNVVAQSGIKHDGVVSPQRGIRGPLT